MKLGGMPGIVRANTAPYGGVGYTVIEVLLFVALTSFLLLVAISNVTSGQRQVQFVQGARDFESQLSDIINDVPTGFYPSNDQLSCRPGVGRPVIDDSGGSGLGKNEDCMYVGKAVQFRPDGNDTKALVFTLAGQRLIGGKPVTSIDEALPVAVANPAVAGFLDSVAEIPLRNGVQVSKVFNGDGPNPLTIDMMYGTIAVLAAFEGSTPAGDMSQAVQIGAVRGTILGNSKQQAFDLINQLQTTSPGNNGEFVRADGGMVVCLIGEGNRKASITLGASGSSGTKLDIDTYDQRCD